MIRGRSILRLYTSHRGLRVSLLPFIGVTASEYTRYTPPIGAGTVPFIAITHPTRRWNTTTHDTKNVELVYENRLASIVARLKTVSLITCGMGVVGMPALVTVVSGHLPISTQCLLVAAAVLSGSITTVALAFVFDPYIYYIEKIPVRQCHARIELLKNKADNAGTTTTATASETAESTTTEPVNPNNTLSSDEQNTLGSSPEESTDTAVLSAEKQTGELQSLKKFATAAPIPSPTEPYLLRAITRNILLMKVETVFDPFTDIKPYNGIRPIANFEAKGKALYILPELLFDETLRQQLHFIIKKKPKLEPEDDDD